MKQPTDFVLQNALGFNLNRSAFLMTEEIARRFKHTGYPISAQDFGILYQLHQQKELSQSDIIKLTLRDKTTITRRIDKLVKQGLVERLVYEQDRRSVYLQLSAQGKKTLPKLISQVQEFQREVMNDIPEQDIQTTLKTLQTIINKLNQ